MKLLSIYFIIFVLLFGPGICPIYAGEIITFGPQETSIEGSVKYTVIGRYTAHFSNFKGKIVLDGDPQMVRLVYLDIDARSIRSDHPWCDKLARSRRLLYTRRYPRIVFKSDQIIQGAGGYTVKGILEMRGIKRRMSFPFQERIIIDPKTNQRILDVKGRWNINRKVFHIIWNKYLDHGGILVSDIFTVNWGIKAYIK